MFSIFKRNKEQTSARELKKYYKIVDQINKLEDKYCPNDRRRASTYDCSI